MRWLFWLVLQYTLWFGQSGHFAQERLRKQLAAQRERVSVIEERNRLLTAEVLALKQDHSSLEGLARRDLGMIRKGEVFYLVAPLGHE